MSRTYEVLKQAEEQKQTEEKQTEEKQTEKQTEQKQVVTVASPPTTPADYLGELELVREAVALNSRPSFFGRMLRFRKSEWLAGQEKEKIPDKSRWIAIMAEARNGWIKWETVINEDDGTTKKVATHVVGKISERFKAPPREELDCQDKTQWRIGLNGKPEDPWKEVCYLPLLSLDGEKVLTFTTATPTGRPRFWNLMDRYAWIGRSHLGQYPIIELQASGYDDKRFGWVPVPDFGIAGWVGRPDPAALLGHGGDGGAGGDTAASTGDGRPEPPPWDEIED